MTDNPSNLGNYVTADTEKIRGEIDALFDGSRDLSEIIEDVARLGARLIIQTAV